MSGHLLHRISTKSDNKCEPYGYKFFRAFALTKDFT